MIYQHPIPSNEKISAFYPASYSIYSEPGRTLFSRRKLQTLKETLGYQHLEVSEKRSFLDKLRPAKPVLDVVPYVEAGSVLDIGCGNGEYSLRLDNLRKSVKPKLVLKSLDYKLNIREALSEKRKIREYLSRLYIPAAKLSGKGDELFAIFTKI